MADNERILATEVDDPLGSMRLVTTVRFGRRVAALSGAAATTPRVDPGVFDNPAGLSWPWPDWTTCTSLTTRVAEDGPVTSG